MRTNLLIILMIVFCSCGRKGTNEATNAGSVKVIDLLTEPKSEITRVSDIATDIDYVPLQTTENSLVDSITKIVTCDNKVYIRNGSDDIVCFNREGNFLFKLNKPGRGPGEYTYITDFDISSDNKILIVLSNGKILVFNNTGTEFIFKNSISLNPLVPTNSYPSKISMIQGTTIILLSVDPNKGSEKFLSILINTDGDTLYFKPNSYRFEKVDKTTRRMSNESLHYDFENKVCFKEEFSDTVFFVNRETNELQPRLIFDSHGKGFPPRVRYDSEYGKKYGNELYWVYLIAETSRYIIYTYEHNRTRNKIVYDKTADKKFKIALKDALEDDINGGPVIDPDFCCESKVYSSVNALTLKKYVAGERFNKTKVSDPERKIELKKLADSLNETDNPVLIIVTPKE